MKECHPSYEGVKAERDKVDSSKIGGNATPKDAQKEEKAEVYKCPFPNCNKNLLTQTGIIKHCYKVHRWSAITKKPVRPRTAHVISLQAR